MSGRIIVCNAHNERIHTEAALADRARVQVRNLVAQGKVTEARVVLADAKERVRRFLGKPKLR